MKSVNDHLNESDMNYWIHLKHSIKQSNRLIVLAIKSYIHGIFPWVLVNAGPLGIYRMYKEIKRMQHIKKIFKKDHDNCQ